MPLDAPSSTLLKYRISLAINALLIAVGIYAGLHRHRPSTAPSDASTAVAIVNGEPIHTADFDRALKVTGGPATLQQLVDQTLIGQAAQKGQVTLDDAESRRVLATYHGEVPENQARARLLLRKMILKDVSEKRKDTIFNLFHDELSQYELSRMVVGSAKDAAAVEKALGSGKAFGDLASHYSRDVDASRNGGALGYLTLPDIQATLGPQASEAVYRVRAGGVTPPLPGAYGWLILKVGQSRTQRKDLEPAVEDLVVNAASEAFLYRLRTAAIITSPFLAARPVSTPVSTPTSNVFAPPASLSHRSGTHVFAAPSTRPSGSSVFAPPSSVPSTSGSSVFSEPSAAPRSSGPNVFASPSLAPHARGSNIFTAPKRAPDTGVFDRPSTVPSP